MTGIDDELTRFLFAILKQKDLSDIDWNTVANDHVLLNPISNGHAARMRYHRFRSLMLKRHSDPKLPQNQAIPAATKASRVSRQVVNLEDDLHSNPRDDFESNAETLYQEPRHGSIQVKLEDEPPAYEAEFSSEMPQSTSAVRRKEGTYGASSRGKDISLKSDIEFKSRMSRVTKPGPPRNNEVGDSSTSSRRSEDVCEIGDPTSNDNVCHHCHQSILRVPKSEESEVDLFSVPPHPRQQESVDIETDLPVSGNTLSADNGTTDTVIIQGTHNTEILKPQQVTTNAAATPRPKQVGIARIRIELLSFTRLNATPDPEWAEVDADDDQGDDGSSRGGNANPSNAGESSGTGSEGRANSQFGGPSGSNGGQNNKRGDGGGGGGGGGNHPRKRRRVNPPDDGTKTLPRFACPYQAFEPSLDCLQRGPRNPQGGCDGIYRLKQHLSRRHMLSYRCQTCWRSFDTKAKQTQHFQESSCRAKPKPIIERFMETDHETAVDILYKNTTQAEEDTWWELFRLLIPGMAAMDYESWSMARSSYCPYYIAANLSLTIPSLNFANMTFPQLELGAGPQMGNSFSFMRHESAPPGQSFLVDFNSINTSTISTPPTVQSSILMSQTLSVPVFESIPDTPFQSHLHVVDPEMTNQPDLDQTMTTEEMEPLGLLFHDPMPGPSSTELQSETNTNTNTSSREDEGENTGSTPISSEDQTSFSRSALATTTGTSTTDPASPFAPVMSTQELPQSEDRHGAASASANNDTNNRYEQGTATSNTTSITQLLRRNNQRLKARGQRAEAENSELRDANRAARAEVSRAEELIEELLMRAVDSESSGQGEGTVRDSSNARAEVSGTGNRTSMYDTLLELSGLLEMVNEKLRRAA